MQEQLTIFASILIVAKNELQHLLRSLPMVLSQDVEFPYEVIVVDSGSTDGSLELIEGLRQSDARLKLIQISPEDFHHARTRNLAVSAARGNYVVFLGGDAVPVDSVWLQKLTAPLVRNGQVAATFGRQIARPEADWANRARISFNYPRQRRKRGETRMTSRERHFFSTVNCCIDVEKAGVPLFDERLPVDEDIGLSRRLVDASWMIDYVPAAAVEHSHNYSIRQMFKRSFDNGVIYEDLGAFNGADRTVARDGLRYLQKGLSTIGARPLALMHFLLFFAASTFGLLLGMNWRRLPRSWGRRLSTYGVTSSAARDAPDEHANGGGQRRSRRRAPSRDKWMTRWLPIGVTAMTVLGLVAFALVRRPAETVPLPTGSLYPGGAVVARNFPVVPDNTYTVTISGSGALELHGAATAVVREGHPVIFRAREAGLTVVPVGGVSNVDITLGSDAPAVFPGTPPTETSGVIRARVAIAGCHASGLGAALELGRAGVSTVMVCSEHVAGGMLTAGQIGFVDGSPIQNWLERPNALPSNGSIPQNSAWALTGGVWKDLRDAIAQQSGMTSAVDTLRYEPRFARAAVEDLLKRRPSVRVLYGTRVSRVQTQVDAGSKSLISATTTGETPATIFADYWVDGSDGGDLVALAGLPYASGDENGTREGNDIVQEYAYRWTAVESDTGLYPRNPPDYYRVFKEDLDSFVQHIWPSYRDTYAIPAGSSWAVHPFRLEGAQGRLTGSPSDVIQLPTTGLAPSGSPVEKWDVNGSMNDIGSFLIARALRTDNVVAALFARYSLKNPYGPTDSDIHHEWANLTYVQDRAPALTGDDRDLLVEKIKGAVKAKALSFLYYIRSGDMQARLRQQPGGNNLTVRAGWSIDNQIGTSDGMPELIYQREGRRVEGEYRLTIYDLDPSFDSDYLRPDKTAQTQPTYFDDGIVVGDYNSDIHRTALRAPDPFFLPWPKQLPFGSIVPRDTTRLLVGSAISADRRSYSAFRLDPIRLMTGGAIGAAIELAIDRGTARFQEIDHLALRERLADSYQATAFYRFAPSIDRSGWRGLELSAAVQRLIARGWLPNALPSRATDLGRIPDVNAPLNGASGNALWDFVRTRPNAPNTVPWTTSFAALAASPLSVLTGLESSRDATVGDAIVWLAARLSVTTSK
jgi:rhamnosyltransferase